MFVLDDQPGWETAMVAELGAAKFHGAWIRIHNAGDFVSVPRHPFAAWMRIFRARPDVNFYAYTYTKKSTGFVASPNRTRPRISCGSTPTAERRTPP